MPIRSKNSRPTTKATKPEAEDDEDEYDEESDDEEYTPPKAKGKKKPRARDEDEDDDEYDDDDEDDEDGAELTGGWGSYKQNKAASSNFPNRLQLEEDPKLCVFLDAEPLVSYNQHWVERAGKKSFVCCAPGQDCPLCALGDSIRTINVFNVLVLDKSAAPAVMTLECGVKLSDILVKKSERLSLTKGYFSIARTGKGGNTNFDVQRVKERDLEEDFGVEPLDPDVLAKAKKEKWAKDKVVNRPTRKELLVIAKEMTGDYDRD